MNELTHKRAVQRITNWLRNSKRCFVVMAELATQNNETPDCIGWYGSGGSLLVECKISRSDFHSDKGKNFRRYEEMGMGDLRYYAADLPAGWGLLEIHEHCIKEVVEATHKTANKQCEVKMLMSAIRRLEISTAVFVQMEVAV